MATGSPNDQPAGTATLLFTDIEGSTRLLQQLGSADYATVLDGHHSIIRSALDRMGGNEVKTEGDSFFAIFGRASDAVAAAVMVQRELAARSWPAGAMVAVRMGIHTGEVGRVANEYVGLDIHRAARISAAAHGGQVVLSETTRDLVGDRLPPGVTLVDLGEHRLKDLDQPEHLFQLAIDGLPRQFPPLRSMASRFDLLPRETTSFVGREAELSRARELLARARLLTLTGPGGTGKTRLALRLARLAAADFDDGAAFVQLASITDPELVVPTIRQTLGFGEEVGRTAVQTLVDRLAGKEVLLVLDNFEQVLPAASEVAELLVGTDRLRIAVTSRAALHVAGEQELPVPPLALPAPDMAQDPILVGQSESVALFVERAKLVRPDFELTAANASTVVAICARLDGLPLALELAASRLKLLPPAVLLGRLERSLDLLQTTAADRTDRQRTLRGAISWSYDLLEEPQRALFRRLAIFAGGFRLEDAEAIVVAPGPVGVDVLDGVSALVDSSLVRPLGDYPDLRFGMLETILEYGREQALDKGELDTLAEALARRVTLLVNEAEPHLTSDRVWLDRLEANHDNIRAALAWLTEHDVQVGLHTGAQLWRFWHLRGYLREGSQVLTGLLRRTEATPPTVERARALVGYAGLVYWQGNYDAARVAYEGALGIARQLGDAQLEVEVLYGLAYVRAIGGDWTAADRDFKAAAELYEQQGNELMATWALEARGMVATLSGEHLRAVQLLDESLARFERLGDSFGRRNTLSVELRALMQLGRLDQAAEFLDRVTRLANDEGDLTGISQSLHDAASLAALAGDVERAARLTGAAQRVVEESGGQPPPELVNRVDAWPMLRVQLDAARLAELLAEGRRMSNGEAIAYALERSP
jgi:predicted ATPase/class 3 adenylate cyclase